MAWLHNGEKISKKCLFVLTELTNVTDRQTYGRTDRQTPHAGIYRAYAYHRAVKIAQTRKFAVFTVPFPHYVNYVRLFPIIVLKNLDFLREITRRYILVIISLHLARNLANDNRSRSASCKRQESNVVFLNNSNFRRIVHRFRHNCIAKCINRELTR